MKHIGSILKDSVYKAINWVKSVMLTENNAEYGIYERIRIDLGIRTDWVRPDCNAEFMLVLERCKEVFGDRSESVLSENIFSWLRSVQNKDGSYNFFIVDGKKFVDDGRPRWQNDNGKTLICLADMYSSTGDARYLKTAEKLAGFWLSVQNKEGLYYSENVPDISHYIYMSPCGILWLAYGMYRMYEITGEKKYLISGERALCYVLGNLMKGGRILTAYETGGSEEWRPFSSEAAIALYAFCNIYGVQPSEKLLAAIKTLGGVVLGLCHPCGAILNQTEKYEGTSLQEGDFLCDLVYTQGFALRALVSAYYVLKDITYLNAAEKLALFLADIQCKNEDPRWNGGWRGAYDVNKKIWSGRANQNNLIDEGGQYSVYTGWCATNIMLGMTEVLKAERVLQAAERQNDTAAGVQQDVCRMII